MGYSGMVCVQFSHDSFFIHARSAKLEFNIEQSSLHYFRTHFSEEQAWLQLVVKEGTQFHQIFSWKGRVRPLNVCQFAKRICEGKQKRQVYEVFRFSPAEISKMTK